MMRVHAHRSQQQARLTLYHIIEGKAMDSGQKQRLWQEEVNKGAVMTPVAAHVSPHDVHAAPRPLAFGGSNHTLRRAPAPALPS